jgi:hypothetical protein
VFSLHQESLKLILVNEPLLGGGGVHYVIVGFQSKLVATHRST